MEIVIKIPEEIYIHLLARYKYQNTDDIGLSELDKVCVSIKNGTLLPEHHGRLIDADEAIKTLKSLGSRDYRREKGTIQEAEKMLSYDDYTPTIIEADKGSDSECQE